MLMFLTVEEGMEHKMFLTVEEGMEHKMLEGVILRN